MSKLKNKGVIIFFILLAALYAVIYIIPKVTGLLNVTYVAQYGELSIYDDTIGYFVRDEHVYAATSSGDVTKLVSEGQLLKIGTPPVEVVGEEVPEPTEEMTAVKDRLGSDVIAVDSYYAQAGGIVSYYVDGLEADLTPETMAEKSFDFFQTVTQGGVLELPEHVHIEYPVFKLVSNGIWYVVAFVPKEHADRYAQGGRADLIIDPSEDMNMAESDNDRLEMTVESAETSGDHCKVILGCDKWFDDMAKLRASNIRIITTGVHGLLLEKTSVAEQDGTSGVYVKNKKGKYDFTPVMILADDGTTIAVSDSYFYDSEGTRVATVDPFDDVLKEPPDDKGSTGKEAKK